MLTAGVYLIAAFVLAAILTRYALAYKKKAKEITIYYILMALSFFLSQIFSVIFIALYFVYHDQTMLYWSDITGRLCVILGAAFVIQIPLTKLWPNDKRRLYVTWLLLAIGLATSVYGLTLRYLPYIDNAGFIHWQVPKSFVIATNVVLFCIWVATAIIHLVEFEKSKYANLASFWFGLGFLLTSLGMVDQDFTTIPALLYAVNILLITGVIFIVIGVFSDKSLS